MNTVFIQANNKQLLGAKLAKYAIERNLKVKDSVSVRIMNVDEMDTFRLFFGNTYARAGKTMRNDEEDLQSFTLSRFMPPELMSYQGRAIVIDPDIFALVDINELFALNLGGNSIAACRRNTAWDTSVMLMDCAGLRHWKISDILGKLQAKQSDYNDVISLRKEVSVLELPRIWNSLDRLTPETKMLHTTKRLTQPWKTGLKIDFTRLRDGDRYFGLIPKPWVMRLLGRWPTRYQPHPDKNIERFFFGLAREALDDGAISREMLKREIEAKNIRPDFFEKTNEK